MAKRVGIDLVSTSTVRDSISAQGDRYLQRVYSAREISDCSSATAVDPQRLAARFAAKEATFKVLRVGDEPIAWRDVEVVGEGAGVVTVSLSGTAAALAERAGITDLALSLTHQAGYAAAIVIGEIRTAGNT